MNERTGWLLLLILSAIAVGIDAYAWISTGWFGSKMIEFRGPMILPSVLVICVLVLSVFRLRVIGRI
jgi:hypothetical protein